MNPETLEEFSSREAARLLGTSASTVRRWVGSGFVEGRQDSRGHLRFDVRGLARLREIAR